MARVYRTVRVVVSPTGDVSVTSYSQAWPGDTTPARNVETRQHTMRWAKTDKPEQVETLVREALLWASGLATPER